MPIVPKPLTPRQEQLCEALDRLTRKQGYSPSIAELATELGVGHSRCHSLLRALLLKGAVACAPGVARSWRLAKGAR